MLTKTCGHAGRGGCTLGNHSSKQSKKKKMDPATLAQIAATHPLVRTVESGEEPTGPAAEAIRRQVESLLAIDMEDPELHEAMDVVADLWKSKGMGNTAENRRNLRSDLERQAVERCEDFVRQMAPMRDMLRQAEANADLLDRQAQDLERTWRGRTRRRAGWSPRTSSCWRRGTSAWREHGRNTNVAFARARARLRLSPNEKAALEAPNVYEERGGDADAFFRALERADAAAADVRRALADPDAAKAAAQEHELVPAGDEGEALLASWMGRRPRPTASSSSSRRRHWAGAPRPQPTPRKSRRIGSRGDGRAAPAQARAPGFDAAPRPLCGLPRRLRRVAARALRRAPQGDSSRTGRRGRRDQNHGPGALRERFISVDAPDFSDGGGRRARLVRRRRPEGARERGRRGARGGRRRPHRRGPRPFG